MVNPLRTGLFGLLFAASLLLLAVNAREQHRQAAVAGDPLEVANADLVARVAITNLPDPTLPARGPLARRALRTALQRYRVLLRAHPRSPTIQQRIGILLGVAEGPAAAWEWFRTRSTEPGLALWQAAYAPGTLSPAARDAALSHVETLGLAWYGELVRMQIYAKAGATMQAQEALARLQRRLRPAVMGAILFSFLASIAVPFGAGVWVAAFILRRHELLRPADRPRPFTAVRRRALIEAFIAWFFVIIAGGWGLRLLLAALDLPRAWPLAVPIGLLLLTQLAAATAGGALILAGTRRQDAGNPPESQPAGSDSGMPSPLHPTREIAYGVITYLAALPLIVLAAAALGRFLPNAPTPPNPAIALALRAQGFWDWAILILVVVVVAPLFEEVFFRGALYAAIRRHAGAGAAVAVTSLFFALVHPQLPLGSLPILALGIVFALAVELRRSLIPSIVAHMLNNGVALLLLAIVRTP
jgi:membrane protease YdiL (CAAX protease family)